jgi:hypothetical protein
MNCEVVGCFRKAHQRGLCQGHLGRLKTKGDVLAHIPLRKRAKDGEPMAWLKAHLDYAGDDCLKWPFHTCPKGYGAIVYNGVSATVARVMCVELFGPPGKGIEAAHSCGNGHQACVNRRHLSWATRKQNAGDRSFHGRTLRGSKVNFAKITQFDALRIMEQLKTGRKQRDIAQQFGVSPQLISAINTGHCWSWLTKGEAA